VVLPNDRDAAQELTSRAAGLVLCGGADVAPDLYGEEPLPEAGLEVLPERDELEITLLRAMQSTATPVWAICRGLQLLNVFLGGSLWQDLPSQRPGKICHQVSEPKDALVHHLEIIETESCLGRILSYETPRVNSRHHQAIKQLAEGLVPIARSTDGLVEAVELIRNDTKGWWVKAVQWHPENLFSVPQQRALWEEFAHIALPGKQ
jgi:putative glutamine amidotransferase